MEEKEGKDLFLFKDEINLQPTRDKLNEGVISFNLLYF